MSTIKVTNIQHASASSAAIALNSDGQATLNGLNFPTAGPLSNRNLIINGAMQVAQRGTQETGVTSTGYFTCDRFQVSLGTLGTWTVDQDTNAPDGFSKSFKLTCTTANASPAASAVAYVRQRIEAQHLQHLNFGTAAAQPLTLSFWVRSNKTGNATCNIRQPDSTYRMVGFQYSISTADTWEYKTISIPADTAGTINDDTGNGLQLEWFLNSGSDYTSGSHQATWTASANANLNPSNLGVGGTTSDNWAITGVQLEVGSVATPFEHRSYGDELHRCERYYQMFTAGIDDRTIAMGAFYNTTFIGCALPFRTTMRSSPTIDASSGGTHFNFYIHGIAHGTSTVTAGGGTTPYAAGIRPSSAVSGTQGSAGEFKSASTSAHLAFSAEL